jgi:phage baseplate assembly protein V|nr:phage baseplate assembly protein V [uncultured Dialister sp.]DAP87065.1 MAG TPA: baseplate assembly protein [Caudoviricetes sp.]
MDTSQLKNMVRVGIVSSVNGPACTARVTFPDKDNMVSAELPVLQLGSYGTKGYCVPEVNTKVVCLFLPNPSGNGMNAGFIIGAYYSGEKPPAESDASVRSVRFPDGSLIQYDNGTITISASKKIVLKAPVININ